MKKTLGSLALLALVLTAGPVFAEDAVTTTSTTTPPVPVLTSYHKPVKATASTSIALKAAKTEYNVAFAAAQKARNAAIKKAQADKKLAMQTLNTTLKNASSSVFKNRNAMVNQAQKHFNEEFKKMRNSTSTASTTQQLRKERNEAINKAWAQARIDHKKAIADYSAQIKAINVKFNTAVKAAQDKFKTDTATLKAALEAKKKAILG